MCVYDAMYGSLSCKGAITQFKHCAPADLPDQSELPPSSVDRFHKMNAFRQLLLS